MACVNVNRSLSDQFYRYKMPKILAKVEGKGNGIKTVIVNMVDIAKSLNRPPMYPTKYFGCVLGAQVNYDTKNERYIVNGSHESNKLQDILDGFIQKYVLCPSCNNPETVLGVHQKRGIITTSCQACGYNGTLANKDKLTAFILKNPPVSGSAAGTAAAGQGSIAPSTRKGKRKEEKKEKVKEKKNGKSKQNGDSNVNLHPSAGDSGDEFFDDTTNGDFEDDWGEDTNPDAVAKRMNELSAGVKSLMLNDDLEKSSKDRLMIFFEFVKKLKESENGGFDINMQKSIVTEAERLDIKDKAVLALCELLLDEKILQQIKTHRLLFLRFTAQNKKAQKYLLRGVEFTINLFKTPLMSRVSHILKAFYDLDILEENVLIDWHAKADKKAVGKEISEEIHEKASPFINWLKEAEEDDEEEDSDDAEEDNEVVFDDRCKATVIQVKEEKQPEPVAKALTVAKSEVDIDIDAI